MKKYTYCFGCDGKVRGDPLTLISQVILTCHLRIFLPLNTSILVGIINLSQLRFDGTAPFLVYWDTV